MASCLADQALGIFVGDACWSVFDLISADHRQYNNPVPNTPVPSTTVAECIGTAATRDKMLLVTAGFTLLSFGMCIPIDDLVVEGLFDGMSANLAQYLPAIMNVGSFFGCLSSGIISDHIGTYNVFTIVCCLAGILVLALWIPTTSAAGIIVFCILFGYSSGAYVSLAAALVVKISPFPQIGYRIGLIFLFASIGGLTTNPIAGALLAHDNGSYSDMKIFSGVILLVGTSLVFCARLYNTGLKLIAKF
ncbi:hypothetical protein N7495_007566 [Penicillium taxi]|uniref:uncharacterized protein n=1 Tax=Penicillium taxi TaxID=168475 RepID=UPI0025455014|nr:uncharacterized protein N7495_007566 [Penicillium taxi]KAJ5887525.1 hypothetical protein N7495_007566 [Penicillium taxi]